MRKVREVLRLKHALGLSYRKISEATGVGKTQAAEYVRRAGGRRASHGRCRRGSTTPRSIGACFRSSATNVLVQRSTGRRCKPSWRVAA